MLKKLKLILMHHGIIEETNFVLELLQVKSSLEYSLKQTTSGLVKLSVTTLNFNLIFLIAGKKIMHKASVVNV